MPHADVFTALSNPVRRKLLEFLCERPRAVNDLVSEFNLNRPAISEHLQVLRNAHLVREEPRGRERYYHLDPRPLVEVKDWLHPFEHYWRKRLQALHDLLDKETT
jgi:DNA-binding transcriptional ArsR family regulator